MPSTFNISVGGDTTKLEKDIQRAAERLRKPLTIRINDNASRALGNITGKATDFNKALDAATARVVAFGAAAGAFNLVRKGVEELLRATAQVENSLTRININLNESQQGLKEFSKNIFEIAKNTGQTFETAAKAAEELTRQGLTAGETVKRLREALILSRLAAIDSGEAVNTLTASINSFSKEALSGYEILNKLAAVDAKFAVSTNDLAQAISRVGSSASEAGVSFNQLLAIVTSVQQTTARGGAVIGNALKTIFTRIERPETLNDLEQLGIGVRDLQGKALPAIQILKNLASTYDELSQSQRSLVAEQVGGVFQINILKAALGDLGKEYSVYDRALQTAAAASDEAIRKNDALNKTLNASFNGLRQSITELFAEFGKVNLNPLLKTIVDGLSGIAKFLSGSNIGDDAGKTIGQNIIQGIGNVLTGPGVVALAAIVQSVVSTLARKVGSEFGDALSASLLRSGALTGISGAGKISAVRTVTPRAAGGLLPSIIGESAAIGAGVGGASANARPVVIPNFAFGGGRRGPIVANTDEYMVPNYANTGGSAIFNRNMVSQFGLPHGAQKLAGGYIPNFATIKTRKKSDIGDDVRVMETENGSSLTYFLDKKTGKINIDYLESQKKGEAFELFNNLGKRAKKLGAPIYTGVLEPQTRQISKAASNFDNLLTIYPQLRYRDQSGLKTKGLLIDNDALQEKTFRSLSSLKSFVNGQRQPEFIKKLVNDRIRFNDIETSFAAGGFVPNFATSQANYFRKYFGLNSDSPLASAVSREISAGVAPGNIYIDSDKRIATASNPLGLLVANRKDEPSGGYQGVDRVINQGGNPKSAGAFAMGYIPNFATYSPNRGDAFDYQDFIGKRGAGGKFASVSENQLIKLNDLFNQMGKVNGDKLKNVIADIIKLEEKFGAGTAGTIGSLIRGNRLSRQRAQKNLASGGEQIPFEDQPSGVRGSAYSYADTFQRNSELDARSKAAKSAILKGNFEASLRNTISTIEGGGFVGEKDIARIRRKASNAVLRQDEFAGVTRKEIQKDRNLKILFNRRLGEIVDPIEDRNAQNRAAEAQRRLEGKQQRQQNRLLGLSIISSFAAPSVENGINSLFGSKTGGTAGGILGGAAGGAFQGLGVGATFGPQAALAGAAIGALVGLFSKLKKSTEEYDEELAQSTALQSKNVDALQQFLQTRGQLDEANAKGASPEVRRRLNDRLNEQFASLNPETANKVVGLNGESALKFLGEEARKLDSRNRSDAQKSALFALSGGATTDDTFGSKVLGNLKSGGRGLAAIGTLGASELIPKIPLGLLGPGTIGQLFSGNGRGAENAGRQIGSNIDNKGAFESVISRKTLIGLLGNEDAGKGEFNRRLLQQALDNIPAFKGQKVTEENFNDLNIALQQAATTANNLAVANKNLQQEEEKRNSYFSKVGLITNQFRTDLEVKEISKQGLAERRGSFEEARLGLISPTVTAADFSKIKLQSQLEEISKQAESRNESLKDRTGQNIRESIAGKFLPLGKEGEEALAGGDFGKLLQIGSKQLPQETKKILEEYNTELQKNNAITQQAIETTKQRNALEAAYETIQRRRNAFLNAPSLGGNEAFGNLANITNKIRTSTGDYQLRKVQQNEAILGVGNEIKSLTGSDKFLTSDFTNLINKTTLEKQKDSAKNFAANALQSVFYENPSNFKTEFGGLKNSKFYEESLKTGIKNTSGQDQAFLKEALAQLTDQTGRKSVEDDPRGLLGPLKDSLEQQEKNIKLLGQTKVTIDNIINGTISIVSSSLSKEETEKTKTLINQVVRDAIAGVYNDIDNKVGKLSGAPNPPSSSTRMDQKLPVKNPQYTSPDGKITIQ